MKYLIKNCKLIHTGSNLNGKVVDILIEKGQIVNIAKAIKDTKAVTITGKKLHASIGWMDIGTHLGEPGYEHRETLESLANAALAGGFTDLATMPKSIPPIQTRGQIKNLREISSGYGIDVHPIGALSVDLKGENITEFLDMNAGGAVGFSDGLNSVAKSGLLLRALQYVKHFGGIILHHPNDESLSNENLIHEGEVSISLGMKGSPSFAEHLTTHRDLELLKYTESKLCLHLISTSESVESVRAAKKNKLAIYSGVSYLNLVKSDLDLNTFDSNLKVKPLLREMKDQKALKKGLLDDTIDYISSNHCPLEIERKHLEFPYASHGAIGLQTCFSALNTNLNSPIILENIIHKLSIGPRKVLGIEIPDFEIGSTAKMTIFDPTLKWTLNNKTNQSLSTNSPFFGQEQIGKVVATINKDHVYLG